MKQAKKETSVLIRMDNNLRAKLQALADKDSRFLTDFIRLQLLKLVK